MKVNKKLLLIILLMMLFPINVFGLNINISMAYSADYSNNGLYYESTIYELYDADGDHAYCLDHGKQVYNGSYYYDGNIWEGPACALVLYSGTGSQTTSLHNRIRYIQYYSNSSFSCSKYWYKSGSCDSNNKKAIDNTNSSLNLTINNTDFELVDNYYINIINVTKSGSITNYTPTLINAPTDAIVTVNKNDTTTVVGSLIDSNVLYVKVPVSSATNGMNFSLNVSGGYATSCSYSIPGLSVYVPNISSSSYYQRLSYPIESGTKTTTSDFTKSSNVDLKLNLIVGNIKITKIDSVTNKPIEGVKFILYTTLNELATYADGSEIGELTTNANGEIIVSNLKYDTYVIREVSTLPVYLQLEEDSNIVLASESEEITISNVPIVIKISKQDLDNHKEVAGATMVVKDTSGKIVKEFVSNTVPTEFYIEPGEYTLEETIAPSGYDNLKTKFKFRVNNDGTIELIDSSTKYLGLNDNIVILYNSLEKVIVPDTLSTINYILIGIGIISIGAGVLIIYKTKKEISKNA